MQLYRLAKKHFVMLLNAGSLVGTTTVTSALGFVYWWLAARHFPPQAVGFASATISSMTLLGTACVLGLGTLLMGELPRQPGREAALMSGALILVGVVGVCCGATFAILASRISVSFQPLGTNVLDIVAFAAGVSLTAITVVLDQGLIGLLRGELQFWRNAIFAVAKLVALFAVGLWLANADGMAIYTTWTIGNLLSLLALGGRLFLRGGKGTERISYRPQWGLLRKLRMAALQHHLLNLILQTPTLALPIIVTAMLSAEMNAWFYVSWMIASFVYVVPFALTTVLYATVSASPTQLAHKIRLTLCIALAICALMNFALQLFVNQILELFGHAYAEAAAWDLRILGLAALLLTIKDHYIAICRIRNRMARALVPMAACVLLELAAAALGAHLAGLSGLSLGWAIAIGVETIFMSGTVFKATWPDVTPSAAMFFSHLLQPRR